MTLTLDLLRAAMGLGEKKAQAWCTPLIVTANEFDIKGPMRLAGFLAQIGHESGGLEILEENLNYSAERLLKIFPKYFTNEQALDYARQPKRIGSRVYANRMGNGDEASGDGFKHRGYGLIQLTGLDNHKACGKALGLDLVNHPEALTEPMNASRSAGWFWKTHGLNRWADAGDLQGMTKAINGGLIGLDDRKQRYERALGVLC